MVGGCNKVWHVARRPEGLTVNERAPWPECRAGCRGEDSMHEPTGAVAVDRLVKGIVFAGTTAIAGMDASRDGANPACNYEEFCCKTGPFVLRQDGAHFRKR